MRTTRIGSVIAGYKLESVIGRGGMSVVYLAEHIRLGRKVALKLLAPELALDDDFRERFMRESQLAAEIDHANIVPIYDAGESDGFLFIAMRYVGGTDLGELLKSSGPLGLGRSLFVIEQLAGALDMAHEHGLVHRDVKPANVLIVEHSDRVYLSDFGIAKRTTSAGFTKTGYFLGTVDYAAPEQIEGRPVDARTDVYALGCLLYACLTGMAPYERDAEVAVMHAHLVEPPPKLTAARPELPAALNHVIAQAMAKDADERYTSAGGLALAARIACREQPTVAPPVSLPDGTRPAETMVAVRQPPLAAPLEPVAAPATVVATEAALPPSAPPVTPAIEASGGGWRKGIAVPALAAALAAAIAGLAVFFVTRDDHNSSGRTAGKASAAGMTTTTSHSSASSGDQSMSMSHTGQMPEGTPKQQLSALIPGPIRKTCQSAMLDGAAARSTCVFDEQAQYGRTEHLDVALFPSRMKADDAFAAAKRAAKIPSGTPPCGLREATGEGTWYHDPTTKKEPGGPYFCSLDGNEALITWESRRTNVVVSAACPCAHPKLFTFWRYWVHEIGVT